MTASRSPQLPMRRVVAEALAQGKSTHDRQRELVRASLICRPAAASPTHRRWA